MQRLKTMAYILLKESLDTRGGETTKLKLQGQTPGHWSGSQETRTAAITWAANRLLGVGLGARMTIF